jgi:hypothetical protein
MAAKNRRVTILLNAALPIAKQGESAENEWPALLTILSSLLERLPEADVRLVLFNLDQQREFLLKEDFTAKDVAGIAHATDVLARWQVDANVLQNPLGGWELIRSLENREIQATPRADTVIFLGLPAKSSQKLPDEMPKSGSAHASRFFYLSYGPQDGRDAQLARSGMGPILIGGRGGGGARGPGGFIPRGSPESGYEQPDPIEQAVRRMGGKTIIISSPDTLSKAISEVKKQGRI